jgi:hypothetical protein
MTPIPPTSVPATLIAGDSWDFTLEFPDYPISAGWSTVEIYFRGIGTMNVDPTDITQDGTKFTIQTDPADSATLAEGRYEWFARLIGAGAVSGQEKVVARGSTMILKNPETATAGDLQSHNEKTLGLIRSEIQARITGTGSSHDSRMIDGFQLNKISMEQLQDLETLYSNRVYRERHKGQLGPDVAFVL